MSYWVGNKSLQFMSTPFQGRQPQQFWALPCTFFINFCSSQLLSRACCLYYANVLLLLWLLFLLCVLLFWDMVSVYSSGCPGTSYVDLAVISASQRSHLPLLPKCGGIKGLSQHAWFKMILCVYVCMCVWCVYIHPLSADAQDHRKRA